MLLAILPAFTRNAQISAPAPFCAVIGAGPAGLIAADVLSRAGARVTVFDHKPSPARKFLMAGRGGLNLTHSEPLEVFLTRYGAAREWLEPIIRAFPPERLREFCAELGEETFVGTSGRVFPKSFKASPLLRALLARLTARGVRFERGAFDGFAGDGALSLRGPEGESRVLAPGAAILALGGASWPRLGSDGGWTRAFDALGVAMTPLAPANCGALIGWSAHFQGAFEGQPIKTILLRHGAAAARGDLVVTRAGLEGGPAYALASSLREETERGGGATLSLNLRPDASAAELARRMEREKGKQSLATFLRKTIKLGKIEMALLREASPHGLPREKRGAREVYQECSARRHGRRRFRAGDFNLGRRPLRRIRRRADAKKAPRRFPRRRNAGFRRADRRLSVAGGFFDRLRRGPRRRALSRACAVRAICAGIFATFRLC